MTGQKVRAVSRAGELSSPPCLRNGLLNQICFFKIAVSETAANKPFSTWQHVQRINLSFLYTARLITALLLLDLSRDALDVTVLESSTEPVHWQFRAHGRFIWQLQSNTWMWFLPPVGTSYHSIAKKISHVTFLETACLACTIQVNASFSNLFRIISQVFPPFFHFFFNVLIYKVV